MKKEISNKLTFIILFCCVVFDQLTKMIAQQYLLGRPGFSYLKDTFRFQYAENQGAFLGLGSNLPDGFRFYFFIVFVFVILGVAVSVFRSYRKVLSSAEMLPIVFIFGGGLSNLIDRLLNEGGVIDFMNVGIGPVRTGIFNVADMFILFGSVFMAVIIWNKTEK